uniref:Uncharacterized protein n=1 Tax=Ciona intestinalis TaxID=7719 RepID=H2XY88_CIOIN
MVITQKENFAVWSNEYPIVCVGGFQLRGMSGHSSLVETNLYQPVDPNDETEFCNMPMQVIL